MNTSTCSICGVSKSPAEYALNQCNDCTKLRDDGVAAFAAANPDAPMSDAIYAGRQAMMARAHSAHRNFVDPRTFSASRGMIPIPPGAPQ